MKLFFIRVDDIHRGGRSRTAATSKIEIFVIIVNDFQPLTIITKCSILDVAAVLDPPLIHAFFISNIFMSNVRLKLAKNQAKLSNPKTVLLLIENYSPSSFTLSSKNNSIYSQKLEAVVRVCSVKKVLLAILQNSKENICARDSFLIKL